MALDQHNALILNAASLYSLDPNWVKSIVQIESSGNTWSMRFEPLFYDSIKIRYRGKFSDTEIVSRATSWGLMQVLGEVARELGYGGRFLTGLCEPMIGLRYGCMKFKQQLDRYNADLLKAVSAYNAGTAIINPDGKFKNQTYVDKFGKALKEIIV